jgi:thiol-disulfide isomerase/thioredoxin
MNIIIQWLLLYMSLLLTQNSLAMSAPPTYVDNLVNAVIESENTGHQILVIFTADWCKYCHILANDLKNNQSLVEDTIVCYIDYNKELDIAKEYDVSSLPTCLIIQSKIEKKRIVGYPGILKFKQWLSTK